MAKEQEREAAREAVMDEMRRQAEEFSWGKPADFEHGVREASTGSAKASPRTNGNGAVGAI